MSEYRVEIKVKNNLILKKIENAGYKTVGKFCNAFNLGQTPVGKLVNLKKIPLLKDGKFISIVYKIADALNCLPEDLFTSTQLRIALESNKKLIEIEEFDLKRFIEDNNKSCPQLEFFNEERKNKVLSILETLTPREKEIILLRYFHELSYVEIAEQLNLSNTRVIQIEWKALRKLRRNENLKDYLNFIPADGIPDLIAPYEVPHDKT